MTIMKNTYKETNSLINQNEDGYYFSSYFGLSLHSVFQPIYTKHNEVIGYEALLRMSDKNGSTICSDQFFNSQRIDTHFKAAVDQLSRRIHVKNFAQSECSDSRLFINTIPRISVDLMDERKQIKRLANKVHEYGLNTQQIVVEIAEGECADNISLQKLTDQLKEAGFSVAIDDFGVRHSTVDRVNLIQPDIIKIDRSIMTQFHQGNKQSLYEALEISDKITAESLIEGIESQQQLNTMKSLNIDMYQGFHLSTPKKLTNKNYRRFI